MSGLNCCLTLHEVSGSLFLFDFSTPNLFPTNASVIPNFLETRLEQLLLLPVPSAGTGAAPVPAGTLAYTLVGRAQAQH